MKFIPVALAWFSLFLTAGPSGFGQNFSIVELSPQANATRFFVTIPAAGQHQFFRLRRP